MKFSVVVAPPRGFTNPDDGFHLLIHLPIEEDRDNNRSCLWRLDHAAFDAKSIFVGALIEE
jgi:hypothetical protein